MDSEQSITVLEGLLAEKGKYLLRTATLLTGSRAEGEDLLQSALEKVIQHWPTLTGDPEGYLRRSRPWSVCSRRPPAWALARWWARPPKRG